MSPDNPIVMRQEILYDVKGRKIATHIKAPDGSIAVDTLIYNYKSELIEKRRVVNGQVVRTWDYSNKKKDDKNEKEFDDNGKLVKLIETDEKYITYSYDSNNNVIQELQFQEGKEHAKYTFEYDKNNRLTSMKTYLIYIGDGTDEPLTYYFEYENHK